MNLIDKIKIWKEKRRYKILHKSIIFLKKKLANTKKAPELFILLDKFDSVESRRIKLLKLGKKWNT